jgi:hypothetical protein
MLGVPPIQKPDAYIHFAPKERIELKYCVSISASRRMRLSRPQMLENAQMHSALAIVVPVEFDRVVRKLAVGPERLITGGGFNGSAFPNVLATKPFLIYPPLSLVETLLLQSENSRERRSVTSMIAPFGSDTIQFSNGKPTAVGRLTWTYIGPKAISGLGVYEFKADGAISEQGYGKIPFATRFWIRIKDSSVERVEMVTPPTRSNLGGIRFALSRIR